MYRVLILLLSSSLLIPTTSFAQGLIPCNGPDCSLCDLLVLINNIYLFVMTWSPIVAVLRIGYAGILMIVNGSNSSKVGEARKSIQDTLLWLAIIYCSFLIVNVVIHLVPVKEELKGSWYKFTCESKDPGLGGTGLKKVVGGKVTLDRAQQSQGGGWVPKGSETPGTGSYTPPKSGWCSEENMKKYFTYNTKLAACVCMAESNGDPSISPPSPNDEYLSTAYCGGYNNPGKYGYNTPQSTVFGLAQINIAANGIGGLNCPAAFSNYEGRGVSGALAKRDACRIINKTLYEKCVTAAKDPVLSLKKFAEMSGNGRNWKPWDSITLHGKCSNVPRS